ncbi:GreA/GreB family elongation factor [Pontibacter sp. JH31]|uniref:GreA/GreB family elongation factor n=1 Tax=Pontibacter aquaedesilientis TaxID=2766980 RepID=A0ABR7XDQ4_9BACT|nr:GreA/GreB family elongation factor [Pontibacter aquaedesilientis]MBD1396426.1 GreA/GreB family elongation factor [Pontibacter aquaedesilientis]
MSRAFVKEDDAGEAPIIPPRAALPAGVPNYVRPQGLEKLRAELEALETERSAVEANRENDADRTRQLTILNGKLNALNGRIASAKVIDPQEQTTDEVRFGATVRLRTIRGSQPGTIRQFTIVGVDEADVTQGLIAFVAPIAQAVTGAKVGEKLLLKLGRLEDEVEVQEIRYDQTS